ncbi:DUF507 family protein [bacterium]|nr:DUF507 family protein [bacterium]
MRLSRAKINHLSHLLINAIEEASNIELLKDSNLVRLDIVRIITQELQMEEVVDEVIREKLSSYSRKILEGSQEWDVLYQKFFEEEMAKRAR